MNICYSGGSKGADSVFGECAKAAGHKVMHFSFFGHSTPCKANVYPLNELFLSQADKPLVAANKILKRKYPTKMEYVNNLLRRNFFQIKDADRVYSITYIEESTSLPMGGTGWAVMMAAQKNIKEIYLYDQNDRRWWRLDSFIDNKMKWIYCYDIPKPHGHYTGIGSHDLTPQGKEAIEKLYA